MITIQFKTSEGVVRGEVEEMKVGEEVSIIDTSILDTLYMLNYYDPSHTLTKDSDGNWWIQLDLNASYYGKPEYLIEIV